MTQDTIIYSLQDFEADLKQLGWRASDFCRATGLHRNTPSRWRTENVPIPAWVGKHLTLLLEIKRLHATYLTPPKD